MFSMHLALAILNLGFQSIFDRQQHFNVQYSGECITSFFLVIVG